MLLDYRINNKKVARAEQSVNHLKKSFEGLRVIDITTPRIQEFIEYRKQAQCRDCTNNFESQPKCPHCGSEEIQAGAANATINRDLSILKRMLNLGAQQTPPKVDRVPYIPMLTENNARQGFFEYGDFIALRSHLPSHLKGFVTFGYKTGMRLTEISKLTWDRVDRIEGYVRLEGIDTKNKNARTVYLDDELRQVFDTQWAHRKASGQLLPYVFVNRSGTDRIKRFDKAWKNACKDAGIGHKIFHDFRRTAVRNMVRAGIPESVAMMISGHKNRNVFERYNIVNESDLKQAAAKQAAYLKTQMGTKTGTIVEISQKDKNASI